MTHAEDKGQYYQDRSTMETCHMENENTLSQDYKQQQVEWKIKFNIFKKSLKQNVMHFLVNKAKYMDRELLCIKL